MNNPTYATALLAAALVTIASCKKNSSEPKPPAAPPHITSFSPASAAKDSTVTIHGTGFSSSASVSFNGKLAVISSASDTILKVVVPVGVQDGRITVKVGDKSDSSSSSFTYIYTIGLMAGSTGGYADGQGSAAKFLTPFGMAADAAGNLFVADLANSLVRKITKDGMVSTFAGTYKNNTIINQPTAVAVDASGNVYVSNITSGRIGKITPAGTISNYAGDGVTGYKNGAAAGAEFYAASGIACDASGNLYLADGLNHVIRKIDVNGNVTTFAGDHKAGHKDGTADAAEFNFPISVAFDAAGNFYVVDQENNMLRKINTSGVVSTLAGSGQKATTDGAGDVAAFNNPLACTVDSHGNIFVTEFYGGNVRKVTPDGVVTTITGSHSVYADGLTPNAFSQPYSITIDGSGTVYVADALTEKIMKIQ
ncbi:MAG: IPT/TIG domain-containing protein [Bacteroidetes bacterium]|nr:IPT/TIG domain-containing protein [Bacteroidota bacterium]